MALKQSTHGFDPLAYMGTPFTPAAVYIQEEDPLPKNQAGIPLGTLWINLTTNRVFFLVAKEYNPITKKIEATWLDMIGIVQVATDAGTAFPVAGVINILGGLNIHTAGAGNTVTIHLDDTVHISGEMIADAGLTTTAGNINLPNTVTDGSAGIIQFGVDRWISNFGNENTFVGKNSGNTTVTGFGSVGIGYLALNALTTGSSNSCVGAFSGEHLTSGGTNSALGYATLNSANVLANANTAIGHFSLHQLLTGKFNTGLGYFSGYNYTGAEDSTICIGSKGLAGDNHVIRIGDDGTDSAQQDTCYIAGTTHITRNLNLKQSDGSGNVGYIYTNDGLGQSRFISNPGTFNTYVGEASGSFIIGTAQGNVGLGHEALTAIQDGNGNVALGDGAGSLVSDNSENVLVGKSAGTALAAGDLNTFVGSRSGQTMNGNAGSIGNTALGHGSLGLCVTGSANLCLGGFAGNSLTTNDSNNVLIAHNGIAGHNREIRLGTQYTGGAGDGQQDKCWIAGIRGVTTTVADAIPVLIDSAGQLGTISSSERYKDDIEDMGPESDMIMALRPVTFTYKSDSTKRMQYGLIAEEVADLFPKLVVYDEDGLPDTVRYHELPILLLNELQKYAMVIENLKERIELLERSKK